MWWSLWRLGHARSKAQWSREARAAEGCGECGKACWEAVEHVAGVAVLGRLRLAGDDACGVLPALHR